jgi:hypothetical protein
MVIVCIHGLKGLNKPITKFILTKNLIVAFKSQNISKLYIQSTSSFRYL